MKKLFLTITVLGALAFTSVAQNANRNAGAQAPVTAEQKADKETSKATSALGLNESQKTTFKKLAVERFNANKPLRDKMKSASTSTEKESIHSQIKANNEKFFTTVNAMLTPDQQTKWADHRKKMQEKQKGNAQHD